MLDRLYQEAQQMLNKEQMGYLTPFQYNLYINSSVEELYFWLIEMYRKATRRSNWQLDGQDLADYKKYYEEMLEYYTFRYVFSAGLASGDEAVFILPDDYRFFRNLHKNSNYAKIEKISYKDYNLMKRNIYSPPTTCNNYCTRLGNSLFLSPAQWSTVINDKLTLTYLRAPKQAVWAYNVLGDKPLYDSTASVEVDAPPSLYDELLIRVLKKAGLNIRDNGVLNYTNLNDSQKMQQENTQ